jgi:uncharacterized protein (TIGR03437 family)
MRILKLTLAASILLGSAVAQPTVFNGGVINGASFIAGQAVAPGSLVSIYGSSLASATVPGDTIPLSATIGETSVTFNGIPAPLLFVSSGQVNAQLPWEVLPQGTATATVSVVVTNQNVTSPPMQVQVAALAPGIFSIPAGAGYAVAINSDGSLAAPAGAIPGIATHPAKVGDALVLYANGLGQVDVPVADGAATPDGLRHTVTVPILMVGGQPANVFFSGLTPQFPGVNQMNFFVPQVPAGNSIPVQLQEGGITTTDKVVVAIQ